MKAFWCFLFYSLLGHSVCAQSVLQSGTVTPGHAAAWITNGVVGDGGPLSGPVFSGATTPNHFACAGSGNPATIIDCGLSAIANNNWTGAQNFNGGATAPTQAPNDNTTNVATTAFVQQGILAGRPYCDVRAQGAVGNGVQDDYAAFNACVTALNAIGGGTLYVSPGSYCVNTQINISSTPILIRGAGLGSALLTCAGNNTVVNLNFNHATITDISIQGGQPNNGAVTNPTIILGTNCGECSIWRTAAAGGTNVIQNLGVDNVFVDNKFFQAYGSANYYALGDNTNVGRGSGWHIRVKYDQGWPNGQPAANTTINAWAGTTLYTSGTVVSANNYLFQAMSTGTSGSVAPTVHNYGQTFADGTVTWQLAAPTPFRAVLLDSWSVANYLVQVDMSGPFSSSMTMANTVGGGGAPNIVFVTDSVFNFITNGFQGNFGNGLKIHGSTFNSCVAPSCTGVNIGTSFGGDASISHSVMFGVKVGIHIATGKNYVVESNQIYGADTGIQIDCSAPVTNVQLLGNILGSSTAWGSNTTGMAVGSGACNYLQGVQTNNFNGASTGLTYAATGTYTDAFPARGSAVLKSVNFNSANTDTQFTVPIPQGAIGYRIAQFQIANASASLSTATIGLFSASGGGGTQVIANSAITVTTGAANTNNNFQSIASSATTTYNFATLFSRIGTAQGSPATGDITVEFTYQY